MDNLKTFPCHVDYRGKIQMVVNNNPVGFKSISIIETEPGGIRANHYHPNDEHLILITEGQILYYEREVGSFLKPALIELNKGDTLYTSANKEHCMYSPCYSVFYCFSILGRDEATYEKETVRLNYSLKEIYDASRR